MGKLVHADVLDGALERLRAATRMVALAAEPASFAAADAARLAEAAMTAGDYVLSAGDVSGRKATVAAKAGVAVIAAGTATHVALLDPATSRLLYVTTCPAQALAAGGTVSFAAWDVEIGAPA